MGSNIYSEFSDIMDNMKKYCLLLVGFICLICTRFLDYSYLISLSTFLWPFCFLHLIKNAEDKKETIKIGLIFLIGFIIRFYGFTGVLIVDLILLAFYGILILSSFSLYTKWSKDNSFLSTLKLPILWMTFFLLLNIIRTPIVFRLDYFLYGTKPLLNLEAILSSYGVNFIMIWLVSLFEYGMIHKSIKSFVPVTCVVVCMFITGLVVNTEQTIENKVKVAYVTGPYCGDFIDYYEIDKETAKKSLGNSIEEAAKNNAEIISFTEETVEIKDYEFEEYISMIQEKALENDIHVLVGFDIQDTGNLNDGKSTNIAVWIDNKGNVLEDYIKHQIIPLIESDHVRGNGVIDCLEIETSKGNQLNASFAICYDSNFSNYISKMDSKTDILFLPSWDWEAITNYHYRVCGSLAIENGVSVIKPTYDGMSIATDCFGNTLALENIGFENVSYVDIPIAHHNTIASKFNSIYLYASPILLFTWICIDLLKKKTSK